VKFFALRSSRVGRVDRAGPAGGWANCLGGYF
jgi:hypothetical protein